MSWVLKFDAPRFLVVRHIYQDPGFYDIVLRWIGGNHPEYLPLFAIHDLPGPIPDYSNYVLHIPWLQDPVQNWSEDAYAAAMQIGSAFEARGVPIVNRVDRLLNATKSVGSRLISQAGLRTPVTKPIATHEEFRDTMMGVPLPLFIREDWGHGGPMVRCETREEAQAADLGQFKRPVAVELIDVRSPKDGLFRKYRYFIAGEIGVRHHMVLADHWVTHGTIRIHSDVARREELAYIDAPEPHHAQFLAASRNLGLEFVAFDYGFDLEGRPVVWEANPYPLIKFGESTTLYRNHAIHRTILAMLTLYLRMGGQKVPGRFQEILGQRARASV
jgi:hypothetical protein